jgi:hypothetical protein
LTFEQVVVLGVLAGAFLAFVTERLPVDLVGLLVMVLLAITGVLSPEQAFGGFASSALITIACMFVLSEGLIRTGALEVLSESLLGLARGRKPRLVVALMLSVAISSAFVNNTPVAVIFLPVVLAVAASLDVLPSRLLLRLRRGRADREIGAGSEVAAAGVLCLREDAADVIRSAERVGGAPDREQLVAIGECVASVADVSGMVVVGAEDAKRRLAAGARQFRAEDWIDVPARVHGGPHVVTVRDVEEPHALHEERTLFREKQRVSLVDGDLKLIAFDLAEVGIDGAIERDA